MLPGCLESVAGQVDRLVVVDGAYADFPHEVPWSTDATREIARCYGAEVIECPGKTWERENVGTCERVAWASQAAKRSAYLVGDEGDWYFMIDADERLVGRLPRDPVPGYAYAFRIEHQSAAGRTTRLWQHAGHMRYEVSHNALWSDDQLVNHLPRVLVPAEEARLLHLTHLRAAERKRDKAVYYRTKESYERPYRTRYRI